MNMSKQEYMEQAWVPFGIRHPPDDPHIWVVCFDCIRKGIATFTARGALEYIQATERLGKDTRNGIFEHIRYTHWMRIYRPIFSYTDNKPRTVSRRVS